MPSSIYSLCGGRNDLSFFGGSTAEKDATTSRKSQQTRASEARASDSGRVNIDYTKLAGDLLKNNDSSMCTQSYIVGSGAIKQTVMVQRTCRCVIFDQIFNSNDQLKAIGRFLRPLIYGKIYYHPTNAPYARLIKRINEIFESLDELVKLLRLAQVVIAPILNGTLVLCNQTSNASTLCSQIGGAQSTMSLITVITEFIACTERNRFAPAGSEDEIIEQGKTKGPTDGFLAGIKFLDDIADNDNLPKHMRFKIRMVLDYVDSTLRTEDR